MSSIAIILPKKVKSDGTIEYGSGHAFINDCRNPDRAPRAVGFAYEVTEGKPSEDLGEHLVVRITLE